MVRKTLFKYRLHQNQKLFDRALATSGSTTDTHSNAVSQSARRTTAPMPLLTTISELSRDHDPHLGDFKKQTPVHAIHVAESVNAITCNKCSHLRQIVRHIKLVPCQNIVDLININPQHHQCTRFPALPYVVRVTFFGLDTTGKRCRIEMNVPSIQDEDTVNGRIVVLAAVTRCSSHKFVE